MKTLQECKDQVAKDRRWSGFHEALVTGTEDELLLISDLAAELYASQYRQSSPEGEGWISVETRLPESNVWVLCIGKTGPAFVGKYTKGHEIEYWDDDYDGPYDEVEDKNGTLYLKSGWYELEEQSHHEYDEMWMPRIVIHWMPLPSPPKYEQPQPNPWPGFKLNSEPQEGEKESVSQSKN